MPTKTDAVAEQEPSRFKEGLAAFLTLRAWDVLWYRVCDDLSGWLILPMMVFCPWAYGTSQPWSIHIMTAGGMTLGVLLLIKLFIRLGKGYPAPRWDYYSVRSGMVSPRRRRAARLLLQGMAMLSMAVLAECLVSACNRAATYDPETRVFHYHHYLAWLPHSLDARRTWSRFWVYLGMAGTFWAARDWLAGMTSAEERRALGGGRQLSEKTLSFPARLNLLLWVLFVNGALLGVEGIIQRLAGTDKLLFMEVVQTRHVAGESCFGPYAYRSNAAQYFNLLWPLCLGFWLTLQRLGGGRFWYHHWLLPCAAIMVACPIISSSRAGALVSVGMLMLAYAYLGLSSLSQSPPTEAKLAADESTPETRAVRSRHRDSSRATGQGSNSVASPVETPAARSPESDIGGVVAAERAMASGGRTGSSAGPTSTARTGGGGEGGGSGGGGTTVLMLLFLVVSLWLGWFFGWDALFPRLEQIGEGYDERADMTTAALPMAHDYPFFGTGAGTFGTVFQLYRFSDEVYWPEQLHNDWLEIRITFGWLGLGLLLAGLAGVGLRWFLPGGMRGNRRFVVLAWLSLAGCLLTARFDFPFQLYSTLLLFLVICAVLLNLGRNSGSSRH